MPIRNLTTIRICCTILKCSEIQAETIDEKAFLTALTLLNEKQKECLHMYFSEGKTYAEIGKILQISCTRAWKIVNEDIPKKLGDTICKALLSGCNESDIVLLVEEQNPTKPVINGTALSDVKLSARLYHCLIKAGYNTLEEVMAVPMKEIQKIPNLGEKCIKELHMRIIEYRVGSKDEMESDT